MGTTCCAATNQGKIDSGSTVSLSAPTTDCKIGVLPPKSKESIEQFFPGAKGGREVEQMIAEQLMRLGFTDDNTLFADSSCPDEICHDDPDEDISSLF